MVCRRCGTEFHNGSFCPQCGMKNEVEKVELKKKESRKIFCHNCGKELVGDMAFCPYCGAKKADIRMDEGVSPDAEPDSTWKEAGGMEPEKAVPKKTVSGKTEWGRNLIAGIWNSSLFTRIAIKFGKILDILEGIVFIILSMVLFKEDNGTILGIFFLLCGICICVGSAAALFNRKNNEEKELDEGDVRKKKRNFCIGVAVLVIALIVFINAGGGSYYMVQSVVFEDMGPETIGELVDENIESPKWSKEKLGSDSQMVYVEGYCPAYGESIRIEFYCRELKDGSYEVSLNGMYLPRNGETFNTFETAMIWASFY